MTVVTADLTHRSRLISPIFPVLFCRPLPPLPLSLPVRSIYELHLESLHPRLCSGRFMLYLEFRETRGRETAVRKHLEMVDFQKCIFQKEGSPVF